jgi:hypothetical protein
MVLGVLRDDIPMRISNSVVIEDWGSELNNFQLLDSMKN